MSSWSVRKPVITYSRSKKRTFADEEPATKRRRIENSEDEEKGNALVASPGVEEVVETSSPITIAPPPTSSPRVAQDVSSDETTASTPPSSPLVLSSSPPAQGHPRRPLFSIFKKQQKPPTAPASGALSDRNPNIPSPAAPRPKKKRLVQMQLDLVGELRKTCKVCGMEYIPSNTEDENLHRKFHAMNVGGVDLTKPFVKRLKQKEVWSGGGGFVAVVGRKDPAALRNKAVEVLNVVNTELAAVAIPERELWSEVQTSVSEPNAVQNKNGTMAATAKRTASAGDRFKAYLYIQGNKCVGACLAERIQEAHVVENQEEAAKGPQTTPTESESSSISVGTTTEPAILGISRIWTSNSHRNQGIATRLLDVACTDFLYGMAIEKEMVAFSQPTESGAKLARKWFGRRAGWHVYID